MVKMAGSCFSQRKKKIIVQKGNNLIAFYSNEMTQLNINLKTSFKYQSYRLGDLRTDNIRMCFI